MKKIWEHFPTWLISLIDKDGYTIANLYTFAPTEEWVKNFFKGVLRDEFSIIVEDANIASTHMPKLRE